MFAVSDRFLAALRESHTVAVRVDAYSGSQCLASDIPISDGSVTVSAGTGVHRKLDVTVADPSLWDTLTTTGVELRAYRGIRFPGGEEELVPLGVFGLDQQTTTVVTKGAIGISSSPDRWARIQRARFETPRVSDTGFTNIDEIIRLVNEVVTARQETGGVTLGNVLSGTAISSAVVWDRDRDKAIEDLCTAAGVEAFFGPQGELIIRDVPAMAAFPVWRVHAGRKGVMLGGTATRDRTRVYNVVVVVSTKTDGTPPFAPQIVADEDATSPTNVNGPYGRVPYFLSTALTGDAASAYQVGKNLLAKTRGRFIDMSVDAVVNPALESGDTISAEGAEGNAALFVVDSFSVPLTTAASQSLTLRTLAAVTGDSATVGTS